MLIKEELLSPTRDDLETSLPRDKTSVDFIKPEFYKIYGCLSLFSKTL